MAHRHHRTALAALIIAGLVTGCSSQARAASKTAANTVDVRVRNFAIDTPAVLRPGRFKLAITNAGPTMHELNVVRTNRAADALPVSADGLVDDQSPHEDFTHLAEAEGLDIGDHASLTLNLPAGNYVMYCNMDGHYQSGMATTFTVRTP
jgi:uncharacterized cupredoxin-like copper-binding protein